MSTTAVVFGGPTPEHDVNILSGLQAARELTAVGEVMAFYWSKAGDWYLVPADLEGSDFLEGVPRSASSLRFEAAPGGGFSAKKKGVLGAKWKALAVEVIVNCCHGSPGEDGTLQGALDLAGLAYTGPTLAGAAIGMDKFTFTALMTAAGLPALPRVLLHQGLSDVEFPGPYIVKPRFGGSSIGIEVVDRLDTAKALLRSSPHLRAGAVIEPYRPTSFDLNVGVRRFPEPQASAIEKPERAGGASSSGGILGYADKYAGGEGMVSAPRELPADLPEQETARIRAMALQIAELCGVRGVARVDFLADGDELFVNEINTIPGSLAKHLFVNPVVPFATLLADMIREARERPSVHWTTSGADGSALRSAGSISGKLS